MKTKTQFTNLYNLQKYFHSEDVCREHLEKFRWNGKVVCPFCNSDKVYRFSDKKTYKCANKECKKKFNATVGTIFENTKLPLSKWFIAMYLITNHRKGISSVQLSKDLGIGQKAAWFVNHRIREMLKGKAPAMLTGIVEVDETLYGGKEKNKHASKRIPYNQGRSTKTKTAMFGLLERGADENNISKVHAQKVDNVKGKTLKPIITEKVKSNATIVTDEWVAYNGLEKLSAYIDGEEQKKNFTHLSVNHSRGQYVDGIAYTNGVENFWSILKRGLNGIYHSVSEKHLNRYLNEFSARYNTRNISEAERFNEVLSQCAGRLKYKQLIADR